MGASLADTDLDDDLDFGETHEINVTPFIDVILVLLIIFMVAAPLSTVDLPIDLPSSMATPQKKPDKPTYVTIKPDLAVAPPARPAFLDGDPPEEAGQADLCHHQARSRGGDRRDAGQARRLGALA